MTFLYEMTSGNVWLWFHLIGALVLLKVLNVRYVALIALVWEIIELYTDGWQTYGTVSNYFADTLGDLLAVPVVYYLNKWKSL